MIGISGAFHRGRLIPDRGFQRGQRRLVASKLSGRSQVDEGIFELLPADAVILDALPRRRQQLAKVGAIHMSGDLPLKSENGIDEDVAGAGISVAFERFQGAPEVLAGSFYLLHALRFAQVRCVANGKLTFCAQPGLKWLVRAEGWRVCGAGIVKREGLTKVEKKRCSGGW
jgi:hypothetical protein